MSVLSLSLGVLPLWGAESNLDPIAEGLTVPVSQTVGYMDHLKTCSPFTMTYTEKGMDKIGQNVIKGFENHKCRVDMIFPTGLVMNCAFSADSIKAMTADDQYTAAFGYTASSTTTPEQAKVILQECQIQTSKKPS